MSGGLYHSDLDALQQALAGHLRGCAALAGIDIFATETADIEDAINQALNAATGVALYVSEVELGGISGDLPFVSADEAQFTVAIYVNPTNNGTGRNAAALREYVMRRLHHWSPGTPGAGVVTLVPDPESGRPRKGMDVRDLSFRLSMQLQAGLD